MINVKDKNGVSTIHITNNKGGDNVTKTEYQISIDRIIQAIDDINNKLNNYDYDKH